MREGERRPCTPSRSSLRNCFMEGITRAIVELFSRLRCLWSSPGPYPSSITAQEGSGEKANGRRSKLSNVTPPCKHRSQPRPEKSGPRYEGVFVVTHFFLLRLPCVFFFLGCFFLLFFFTRPCMCLCVHVAGLASNGRVKEARRWEEWTEDGPWCDGR